MKAFIRHPAVQLAFRILVGGFFAYASLDKIWNPASFARIIYQWRLVGVVSSNLVAATLPWVELVAGVFLILGIWKRESALIIALLLVVFIGAAGSVMARGVDIENCGCVSVGNGGASSSLLPDWVERVGWGLIGRNLVLLAMAVVLVLETRRSGSTSAMDQA